jgi:hypothetical protein
MITPDGYIFDKEAILSYIVGQKKEQKRLMKAYEKYLEMEEQKKKMVVCLFNSQYHSHLRPKMLKTRKSDANSVLWSRLRLISSVTVFRSPPHRSASPTMNLKMDQARRKANQKKIAFQIWQVNAANNGNHSGFRN